MVTAKDGEDTQLKGANKAWPRIGVVPSSILSLVKLGASSSQENNEAYILLTMSRQLRKQHHQPRPPPGGGVGTMINVQNRTLLCGLERDGMVDFQA